MSPAVKVVLDLLALAQAGMDIAAAAGAMYSKLKAIQDAGREPTPAEWDELNGEIARLRGELHAG